MFKLWITLMANKIKFDRENVVQLASQLFWQKGFHATSTRDLQNTIDMRPGSIYAAFGSKEGLYCEALKNYTKSMQATLDECLADNESILAGLKLFVQQVVIADDKCNQPSEICMLVKANAEFSEQQPQLKALSENLLGQFEQYLAEIFSTAQYNNELPDNLPAIEYARLFQVQFTGLRSYLHRPQPDNIAKSLIDNMFVMLKQL